MIINSYIYSTILIKIKIEFKNGASTKKCVCPDEKAFHTFFTRSKTFNTDVGMNVTIIVYCLFKFKPLN
jgi:hypothetical protein